MNFPIPQRVTATSVSVCELRKLERKGKYQEALNSLGEIWSDPPETKPQLRHFAPQTAAEVLLRCGALIGFWAHNRQIQDGQDFSKDLLSEAHTYFVSADDTNNIAECENYLALAYWRAGEIKEARLWLQISLEHRLSESDPVRLYSTLINILIESVESNYSEVLKIATENESFFLKYGDPFLKGCFYTNYGLGLKNTGNIADAFRKLEMARFYHQKSGHKIYLATVENNLAQIFKIQKRFDKAHESINKARKIFKQLGDSARESYCFDTKAQIYLAEEKLSIALKTVEKAETILRTGDSRNYLLDTLLTKIKILIYSDDSANAVFCLSDAVQIARTYFGEEFARTIVGKYEEIVSEKRLLAENEVEIVHQIPEETEETKDFLELLLPSSLVQYQSVQGVWLTNHHLESFGLTEGALVIVAQIPVQRGDLIAVTEKSSDEAICGFYDADFGIICLDKPGSEPQLFDENEVEILGKIVGFSREGNTENGKLIVEEVKI